MRTIYSYEDTPTGNQWSLVPLFSIDQKEKVRIWHITFDGDASTLSVRTGILCPKEDFEEKEMNPAFSSGAFLDEAFSLHSAYKRLNPFLLDVKPKAKRDVVQQGALDAKSRWKKKKDSGYTPDLDGLLRGTAEIGFKFQLAETYKLPGDPEYKEILTEDNFRIGVVAQVKEDGDRCLSYLQEGQVLVVSRKNLPYNWLEKQRAQLLLLFNHLPSGSYLDGELTHPEGLEAIRSILARKERHEKMDEAVYYIFDVFCGPTAVLEERIEILDKAFTAYKEEPEYEDGVVLRLENIILHSPDELREFYEATIARGKEGIMIRKLSGSQFLRESLYIGARNKNLLKVKPFDDAEAKIVEVVEGKGTNKGCAIFLLEMESGLRFKCKPHGTIIDGRKFFQQRETLIGRTYTYKHNGYTNKRTPSKATGIAFRD